jgi:peptide/nickel transport system substrate-binding protein
MKASDDKRNAARDVASGRSGRTWFVAAAACCVAAMIAGCAAPNSAPSSGAETASVVPAASSSSTAPAAPVRTPWPPVFKPEQMGGTLYRNLTGEPLTLNPLTYKDLYTTYIHDYVFESLFERDPDTLEFRPMLADKWQISPDGLVITFHLDPRAKFSDGTPVTPEDVIFTYETIANKDVDCAGLRSYFEDCKGCEKVDDHTVRFTWKKPYFKSLELSAIVVLPKHVYEFKDPKEFNDLSRKLVGSGPYVFKEWKTGQHIILERNPNYWLYKPAIDSIVFRFILEEQAEVQSMLAGDLDYVSVTPEWWVKLQSQPDVVKRFQWWRYSISADGYNYIGWNNERPPFNDKRVRQAMTQLIWREQLLKHMWYDVGSVATGPFWPRSPQVDPAIKPWPYDRKAALKLLKEAGWEDRNGDGWLRDAAGNKFEFEFRSSANSQLVRDVVRVIQEEFRRAGIDMHVRLFEFAVFMKVLDNRDFDATMLSWGGGDIEDDPYQIWDSKSIGKQGSNHINFRNPEADRLIETARGTVDPVKRNELFREFHRLIHEEQPYTFMVARESLRMLSPRIKGAVLHKLGPDYREWWLAKDAPAGKEAATP